ncbi:MAG: hypothetical protein ACXWVS_03570 [Hyphomicrobium sp.]
MQTTTAQPLGIPATKASASSSRSDFLTGLALTAFVPTIFWIAVFAAVAGMIGYPLDLSALLLAGSAIAAFLGAFFIVLSAKSN